MTEDGGSERINNGVNNSGIEGRIDGFSENLTNANNGTGGNNASENNGVGNAYKNNAHKKMYDAMNKEKEETPLDFSAQIIGENDNLDDLLRKSKLKHNKRKNPPLTPSQAKEKLMDIVDLRDLVGLDFTNSYQNENAPIQIKTTLLEKIGYFLSPDKDKYYINLARRKISSKHYLTLINSVLGEVERKYNNTIDSLEIQLENTKKKMIEYDDKKREIKNEVTDYMKIIELIRMRIEEYNMKIQDYTVKLRDKNDLNLRNKKRDLEIEVKNLKGEWKEKENRLKMGLSRAEIYHNAYKEYDRIYSSLLEKKADAALLKDYAQVYIEKVNIMKDEGVVGMTPETLLNDYNGLRKIKEILQSISEGSKPYKSPLAGKEQDEPLFYDEDTVNDNMEDELNINNARMIYDKIMNL